MLLDLMGGQNIHTMGVIDGNKGLDGHNDRPKDHLFDTVGKQVTELSLDDVKGGDDESEEGKVVDKIESLCMNCHADVSGRKVTVSKIKQLNIEN